MVARPLIVDCDPGVDDAIALLLAIAHADQLELQGITTVAGNVPLALTQKNARKICELAGRADLAVYAGCPRPLLRPLETATEIHGESGLEGANLPDPQMPLQDIHAVEFLIHTLQQATAPMTLAALGPLTNLAIALIQAPDIARNIEQLVIMGGAITTGNVTAAAEFNFYVDPHAAKVIFESGLDITLLSLDVTHQVLTTPERLRRIRAIDTPVGQTAANLLAHYGQAESDRYDLPGPPLHDPCVIAYLLQPALFTGRSLRVDIETISPLNLGRSVVDCRQASSLPANATVIETVDAPGFYDLLAKSLAKL